MIYMENNWTFHRMVYYDNSKLNVTFDQKCGVVKM